MLPSRSQTVSGLSASVVIYTDKAHTCNLTIYMLASQPLSSFRFRIVFYSGSYLQGVVPCSQSRFNTLLNVLLARSVRTLLWRLAWYCLSPFSLENHKSTNVLKVLRCPWTKSKLASVAVAQKGTQWPACSHMAEERDPLVFLRFHLLSTHLPFFPTD